MVEISASICEVKKAKDSTTTKVVLVKIIPEQEQKEILKKALKDRGYKEVEGSDGQVLIKKEGDVVQIADLEDMTITATVQKEEEIKRKKTIQVTGDRDRETPESLRARKKVELEKSIQITDEEKEAVQAKLQKEISETLEKTKDQRMKELNEVVKDVYAESLKKKAERIGKVTSIKEGINKDGEYELRIKITE